MFRKIIPPQNLVFLRDNAEVDMPVCYNRKQYEKLSKFQRGRVIEFMEAGWSSRHRRLHLEGCRARSDCTATKWNQVDFIDGSRFNFSSDVGRPHGERLNLAFALQRHTTPTVVR
ncbi:hypothetical protein TNCV_2786621 [Trichonephila clavipes]|nr:hypothetical protein TNCV_2786621 [Trichonephila clavipes]